MRLRPVSLLDILVFLSFLAFHLVRHADLFHRAIRCALTALPFLFIELPIQLVKERYFTATKQQLPFTRRASIFQDVAVRCMRWGFTNLPSDVGRVFFCKGVAVPYLKFRLLRSGYHGSKRDCPAWVEIDQAGVKGLWISYDTAARPDITIYYVHGGGFVMGSSYFYLEFLMTWVSVLKEYGFKNPAVFALSYTLVPDERFPYQLHETLAGYNYVMSRALDPDTIVVSGDSAGALLILAMLLYLGTKGRVERPAFAALVSPWTNLVSENRNTASDFLDVDQLNEYGRQYAGSEDPRDPLVSPGDCRDLSLWAASMPRRGIGLYFGSEEMLRSRIHDLGKRLDSLGRVICREDENLHVWPVAAMFLESDDTKRRKGLRVMSGDIAAVIGGAGG